MVVVGLIQEIFGLLNGLLGHFVSGTTVTPELQTDGEWIFMGINRSYEMTLKGNYLMGAVADIVTYGAILVDWIVQAMLSFPVKANTAP